MKVKRTLKNRRIAGTWSSCCSKEEFIFPLGLRARPYPEGIALVYHCRGGPEVPCWWNLTGDVSSRVPEERSSLEGIPHATNHSDGVLGGAADHC